MWGGGIGAGCEQRKGTGLRAGREGGEGMPGLQWEKPADSTESELPEAGRTATAS